MLKAGIVAIDSDEKWSGGRYYLQHLIRCVASLAPEERIGLCSVSWMAPPRKDPFEEVRALLGDAIVVAPPAGLIQRLLRKIRRMLTGIRGARDLFDARGIDVFFPVPPCENSGATYVAWLPDFQHLRRPDLMSDELRLGFERYFSAHAQAATQIVLSSGDAQNDFAKVFPEFLDRTHVVRFCSVPDEEWWRLDPAEVAARYGLPERFLIVCNQLTRHKNHLTLLAALRMAMDRGAPDVHLVCTGSTYDYRHEDYVGQVQEFVRRNGMEANVHILGLIPREQQIALLRRSVAVMQPSWFEGWSTIVEDAKTLGKPLLVSDLPVHREQLGDAQPYYLALDDPGEWADAILSAWSQLKAGPDLRNEAAGIAKLQDAKRACGLAFVNALTSAVRLAS